MNNWQKVINVSLAVIVTLLIYQNTQLKERLSSLDLATLEMSIENDITLANLKSDINALTELVDVLKEFVDFNREDIEVNHENTEKLYAKSEDAREVINTLIDQSNENKSKISEVVIFLDGVYNN
ncbi:hypothetical protein N9Y24_01330 [Gammaproteobacteria bacterium]|nr:hypothetical protein [Gammaproteobacteria bacterium]|tara:strand:- start:200 stop:574 length:375 start_codon:yes stop_codon:yes gene_type:complete